jgi:hypothetical protein
MDDVCGGIQCEGPRNIPCADRGNCQTPRQVPQGLTDVVVDGYQVPRSLDGFDRRAETDVTNGWPESGAPSSMGEFQGEFQHGFWI